MPRYLILLAVLLTWSAAWAADASEVRSEQILHTRSSWDGKTYQAYPPGQPEVTLLRITIPAHTSLDWHRHPIINVGYMLTGSLEVENQESGDKILLHAGDPLPELVSTKHCGRNPGDEPAVILVFYAGVAGSALSEK